MWTLQIHGANMCSPRGFHIWQPMGPKCMEPAVKSLDLGLYVDYPFRPYAWSHLGVCIDKLMSIHSILCLFHSDPRSGEIYNCITFTAVMSS